MSKVCSLVLTGRTFKDVRAELAQIERDYEGGDYEVVILGEKGGLWNYAKIAEIKEALDGDLHQFLVVKGLIPKNKTTKTGSFDGLMIVDDPDCIHETEKGPRRVKLRQATNRTPKKKKKKKGKKTHRK